MHKSFELPLSSKNLFLVSREEHSGYPGGRTVKIVSSPDLRDDVIKVDVSIMHQDVDWLAGVKTCLVSRKKEENGVGIFVLPYQSSNRQSWYLQIDILVTVPEVGWDPVRIKSFETDLPLYTHALGSLTDFVEFDKLSLKSSNAAIQAQSLKVYDQCTIHTSNGPVKIESLVASNARVETSNGPITGHYDATGSLGLYSSDGNIDATINLTSSDQKGELFMKTSNGYVLCCHL
ncbi:hypothetical protein K435DRAFT_645638 [Dendrothele bispora CBS 962.96]|uniref:DUF4097 domain-containing protein n=1 Tax=Dendrothele bispora (strain CBS 962.96) TaxID=1314807 RepID=A0A4S8MUS5_DENBC|nr:hypothetical protein K435DRAFT_645638 [Dendrothele bispora CBS 962.96]